MNTLLFYLTSSTKDKKLLMLSLKQILTNFNHIFYIEDKNRNYDFAYKIRIYVLSYVY